MGLKTIKDRVDWFEKKEEEEEEEEEESACVLCASK